MRIHDILFSAIRCGMEQDISNIELSMEACNSLLEISIGQSILPVVYRGLKRMNIPADCINQFDRAWIRNVFWHSQRQEALRKITSALDDAQIPYVPLKGAVLQYLYPVPNMRTSGDIDILTREEDLDRAVHAIEENAGFSYVQRNYHDVNMTNSRVVLELHFSIKENMENIDKLLSKAWDYAEPTGEGYRYSFTPEYQVFHVIAHMSYHLVHGGLGIRPFLDLWLLKNKTNFDEDVVRRMCDDCGILTFYEKSYELVDAWMSGKPVPDDLVLLEEYCLSGGVFGSIESTSASRLRKKGKSDYVMSRLIVSQDVLEDQYPELRDKPFLMPVYQMKRWMRLLDKEKRAGAMREIDGISKVKDGEIEKFDEMLRGVGV